MLIEMSRDWKWFLQDCSAMLSFVRYCAVSSALIAKYRSRVAQMKTIPIFEQHTVFYAGYEKGCLPRFFATFLVSYVEERPR